MTVTKLSAFFKANVEFPEVAGAVTYRDFPRVMVWKQPLEKWAPRQKGMAFGRISFVSPAAGEKFFLRILLLIVRGPTSFVSLRTVQDVTHPTFKAACLALGLLQDDEEWKQCLQEASAMQTGSQLRSLFATMLTHCEMVDPRALWEQFKVHICDDVRVKLLQRGFQDPSDDQVYDYGLYLLQYALNRLGRSLADYPEMPIPALPWDDLQGNNRFIVEQLDYVQEDELARLNERLSLMNVEQRSAYDAIVASVTNALGQTFFLHGPAGTGKTFVYNTICYRLRSDGLIVLCVASSGIASLLLIGGRTAHSRFKIPLDINPTSFCHIGANSPLADMLRKVKLIIWDEAPMQHRWGPEALDRTLQDICRQERPFGGITTVFGGDMKQILPVIVRGGREDIVAASLCRSGLWRSIQVLHLRVNMRLGQNAENAEFAEWLLNVGNGIDLAEDNSIHFPEHMKCPENTLDSLIQAIYPDLATRVLEDAFFLERTILSSRNDDVAEVNEKVLDLFPGEELMFHGADRLIPGEGQQDEQVYPIEFLNSIATSGLPPAHLAVKIGCPLMVLRNLIPDQGICNGTRVILTHRANRVLEVRLLGGEHAGKTAFIPRVKLTPSNDDIPVSFERRQFPLRLAFAMTINKSQGQSVKHVGIDLRTPVFTHGQLYVALSRTTSRDGLKILFPTDEPVSKNIVYKEVLLN